MARTTKTANTNGTAFTGTEYSEALANRGVAMKAFDAGEMDAATKSGFRAIVRQMRNAITKSGMTVQEWREAEQIREAALTQSRKRSRKPRTESTEPAAV